MIGRNLRTELPTFQSKIKKKEKKKQKQKFPKIKKKENSVNERNYPLKHGAFRKER